MGVPAAQASAAGPAAQAVPAKPADDSKRNVAYAQTQHHGASAAAPQAARAPAPVATAPRAAAAASEAFDPHAETDPPGPLEPASANDGMGETPGEDPSASHEPKYLPGDPMGPQPVATRSPILRYDDSIPRLSRRGGPDKKWLWIATGMIVLACLGLVFVLASRMSH
jgi:hypothetical protein